MPRALRMSDYPVNLGVMADVGRNSKAWVFLGLAVSGWAAIAFLWVLTMMTSQIGWPHASLFRSTAGWGLPTLLAAIVVGVLAAVLVRKYTDATWRDDARRRDWVQTSGLVLCAIAWFVGGLWTYFLYELLVPYNFISNQAGFACGGSSGLGTFQCVHRANLFMHILGIVLALAATPVALKLVRSGRNRSRLWAFLSVPLILGLYLLAVRVWLPHVGLGGD